MKRAVVLSILVLSAIGLAAAVVSRGIRGTASTRDTGPERPSNDPSGAVTYYGDVEPVIAERCAGCHRAGEVAPFPLTSYDEVRPVADLIAAAVSSGRMPPWLPEDGYQRYRRDRSLSEREIELILRWARRGAPEGTVPSDGPTRAREPGHDTWALGAPDRVLRLDDAYAMPAAGPDLFRNFVLDAGVDETRWVEAVEIRPVNRRLVHHAILMVDRTGSSRRLDGRDSAPGFEGMFNKSNAQFPEGFFLGWTPGRFPAREREGTAWRLDPGSDVVAQLHLRPDGAPGDVGLEVGLHFASDPPARHPVMIRLVNELIDIPPGAQHHTVRDRIPIPFDVEVLSLYPHAHHLGKEVKVYATLPGGGAEWLLQIKRWDFNWQDQYSLETPVRLPAGSEIHMEWTFDNSAQNPNNPNSPPRRVMRGLRSSDEMAELFVQVQTVDPSETALLRRWLSVLGSPHTPEAYAEHYAQTVAFRPEDADARFRLGVALEALGREAEALDAFTAAARLEPEWPEPPVRLARLRADSEASNVRDPVAAMQWAEVASRLTEAQDPEALDALAAAHAANGRWDVATRTAVRALELARDQGRAGLASRISERRDAYRRGAQGTRRPEGADTP